MQTFCLGVEGREVFGELFFQGGCMLNCFFYILINATCLSLQTVLTENCRFKKLISKSILIDHNKINRINHKERWL